MITVIMFILAVFTQIGLNKYSNGKDFELPQKKQIYAIVMNVVVWMLFVTKHDFSLNLLLICLAFSILTSTFFIDIQYKIIPNEYNLGLFLLGIVFVINNHTHWLVFVKGGLYFVFVFALIFVISRQLGFGDVKMSISIGMFLGSGLLMNYLMVTFLTGAVVSIILLLLKKQNLKGHIAFGPYMVLAFFYLLIM